MQLSTIKLIHLFYLCKRFVTRILTISLNMVINLYFMVISLHVFCGGVNTYKDNGNSLKISLPQDLPPLKIEMMAEMRRCSISGER